MHRRVGLWLMVCLALGLVTPSAWAQEKANPSGTWKWTFETPGGQKIDSSMKLKMEGDKLTGVVIGRDNQETKIENAQIKGNEISFQVTRERDGQKFTIKYQGKVTGDTIKGKMEVNFGGEDRSFDWEAKRAKD
jgi:hypothetical protein